MTDKYSDVGSSIFVYHLARLSLEKISSQMGKDTLNGVRLTGTSLPVREERTDSTFQTFVD